MKEDHNKIDFDYVRTMLCEEYIGYNLQDVEQVSSAY